MRLILLVSGLLLFPSVIFAQHIKKTQTGNFSGIFTTPLSYSTTHDDLSKPKWDIIFQSLPNEGEENLFHVKELKGIKMREKIASISNGTSFSTANKTTGINPTIGTNFKGQELKSWTPTDNSIAVSKGGMIVSCINQGIAYYDTSGTTHMIGQSWTGFINDTSLKSAMFDPHVIYDSLHDRFIVVLLHGFSSGQSKVLVFFSKSNYPLDGWYGYKLTGNPFSGISIPDTSWTDYPTIGINDDELFINGNRFGDPALNYPWHGTYIYQINLSNGYLGTTLNYGAWNNILTPDSIDAPTAYPASNGLGQRIKDNMYFVQLMPDSGSAVYVYKIEGSLSSPSQTITSTKYPIPHYDVCANAFQKDPTSGMVDSLSTGSAWIQNAFMLNNVIHFTFDADMGNGWCGIHYGRVYLDSNKAVVTSFGEPGTDMCYPAIASLGYDSLDKSVAIAFLRSDTTITPETDVIILDSVMTWSAKQTVKAGDTSVNILYPPDYPVMPERWGDYTGICRNYTSGIPQVWMAGAYGANTPPRNNSYGTWIAQIITGEAVATGVSSIGGETSKTLLYPNPASDLFALEFDNTEDGNVSVDLYDATGKLVRNLFSDYLRKSANRLSFNRLMLSTGTYFVVITREREKIGTEKLTVR